eukprot:g41045.t1
MVVGHLYLMGGEKCPVFYHIEPVHLGKLKMFHLEGVTGESEANSSVPQWDRCPLLVLREFQKASNECHIWDLTEDELTEL